MEIRVLRYFLSCMGGKHSEGSGNPACHPADPKQAADAVGIALMAEMAFKSYRFYFLSPGQEFRMREPEQSTQKELSFTAVPLR